MRRISKALLLVWITLSVAVWADQAAIDRLSGATGLTFSVPASFTQKVDPKDGELQLENTDGDFIAIQKGDSLQGTFDNTLAILTKAGKGTLKADKTPTTEEHGGLQCMMQAGTMTIDGKPMLWLIIVVNGNKAPLRFVGIGPKLNDCKPFYTMLDTVEAAK